MAKFSDDFYQACVAMRNAPGPQRFVESLNEYLAEVRKDNDVLSGEAMLRSQGRAQMLNEILEGFYTADKSVRRIDERDSGGPGPSVMATT